MAVAGLGSGLSIGREASYNDGTSTPTVVLPYVSDSLEVVNTYSDGRTLAAGALVQAQSDRRISNTSVAGTTSGLLTNIGVELLFDAGFGGYAYADGGGAPGRNQHTFTPGALRSYVLQKQIGAPPATGNPWIATVRGCVAASMSSAIALGENVTQELTWIGSDEVVTNDGTVPFAGTAPADQKTYTAIDAAVVIGGDANRCVQSVNWTIDNSVIARYCLGQNTLVNQPPRNDFTTITGTIVVDHEHDKRALYDAFRAGQTLSLVVTLQENVTPPPANPDRVVLSFNIWPEGESQKVGGPDILERTIPWTGFRTAPGDADDTAAKVVVDSLTTDLGA